MTLVQVAAAAGTSTNTAAKFEVAEDSVLASRRAALAAVYDRFPLTHATRTA